MPAKRYIHSPAQRMGVIVFMLSPLAVVAVLCVLIWLALRNPTIVKQQPVGAGAGATGMSNEHHRPSHPPQPSERESTDQKPPPGSP
jgi:hypothetical protein